jgi:Ni/Fe-hydrogenase 1 B-type cytochrome subunit
VNVMAKLPSSGVAVERVYVWELPVRLTHWLIFFSFLALAATGFFIGRPFVAVVGPARDHFVMGTARAIHLYAAIVFALSTLARLYWLFAGNRYARLTQLLPFGRERLRSFWEAAMFYAFMRREAEECVGHNALAGSSYAMIYGVYLVMIATGLALYTVDAPPASPFQAFAALTPLFGGLPMAALIHHVGMWVVLIFAAMHIYFVVLASIAERIGTFDSIVSGYKFVSKRKAGLS